MSTQRSSQPGLYGLRHSNRDFTKKKAWGKNCFNSSFPASLCAYLHSKNLESIYIKLASDLSVEHSNISTSNLYKMDPSSDNLFYAFETQFTPYQRYLIGTLPRVDLVTQERNTGICLSPIEIKLTALPDNTTCDLTEDQYGCEIVIRPDTIVYLACSIVENLGWNEIASNKIIEKGFKRISDWSKQELVIPYIPDMIDVIDSIALSAIEYQQPFLMQPIWKTQGKSLKLSESCLDIFVWSNFAFTRLFVDLTKSKFESQGKVREISRRTRAVIWLFKMLYDFSINSCFDHKTITSTLTYSSQSDKAFAVSGKVTRAYMESEVLSQPRIRKEEIKRIVLGGGQNLLSPERRFDAIIYDSNELFGHNT